jgi:hypothetical protein
MKRKKEALINLPKNLSRLAGTGRGKPVAESRKKKPTYCRKG